MRLLNKHQVILRRRAKGYINSQGDWTQGDATDTTIRGCVQPRYNKSEFQKVLPEGVRESHTREFYTRILLRTTSELTGDIADIIEFQGVEYEVFEVSEWFSATEELSHYKALMIRRDVLNAIS